MHSQIRRFADSRIQRFVRRPGPAGPTLLVVALAAVASGILYGQARSAPDWTTSGFDAQRSSWVRADPYISIPNLTKFQFIWKLKVDNESRFGNSLTAPVALGNLMTFRGFKSLVFVGGSSNNVYAIDYDFGTIFWRTHHNYAAGAREFSGSPACPGGMTMPLTRATPLVPPAQLAFFGFARPPRPAKGDIGEPGKGAPQLAEIAARLAARGNSGRGAETPAPASPARGAASASAPASRTATADKPVAPSTRVVRPTTAVFSVAADGLLRGLIPDTGDLALAPARFLPANATATGLIWTEGFVYAATTNTCGGTSEAVWAMDVASDARPVVSWDTGGAPVAGIAVGPDGYCVRRYRKRHVSIRQFDRGIGRRDADRARLGHARVRVYVGAGRVHRRAEVVRDGHVGWPAPCLRCRLAGRRQSSRAAGHDGRCRTALRP